MTRIVKTVTADGGSGGGGAGLQASDVCKIISDSIIGTGGTTLLPKCQGQWELICNCDIWTDCYASPVTFDLDTNNYRAFKWCFQGMSQCGCKYHYFCAMFHPSSGASPTGSHYYKWMDMQGDKNWPGGSCCCWQNNSGDCICWCWYCCNSTCWLPQSLSIEIGNSSHGSQTNSPANANNGRTCYDICYGARFAACDYANCNVGVNRVQGVLWNWPGVWSEKQNSGCYITKFQITASQGFIPSTSGGTWSAAAGNLALGTPCWSMYGIPCTRPTFVGCNPQSTTFA